MKFYSSHLQCCLSIYSRPNTRVVTGSIFRGMTSKHLYSCLRYTCILSDLISRFFCKQKWECLAWLDFKTSVFDEKSEWPSGGTGLYLYFLLLVRASWWQCVWWGEPGPRWLWYSMPISFFQPYRHECVRSPKTVPKSHGRVASETVRPPAAENIDR
jgi:hypothetical protein